tara:strand:- start:461 stop:646 length:186 start_codon:yes stop_codon:yes gene_type:complete
MVFWNEMVGYCVEIEIDGQKYDGAVINGNNWTENQPDHVAIELDSGEIFDYKICQIKVKKT